MYKIAISSISQTKSGLIKFQGCTGVNLVIVFIQYSSDGVSHFIPTADVFVTIRYFVNHTIQNSYSHMCGLHSSVRKSINAIFYIFSVNQVFSRFNLQIPILYLVLEMPKGTTACFISAQLQFITII